MRLPKSAYLWAFRHLITDGDSDLFPRPLELAALNYHRAHGVIADLANLDLSTYEWRGGRRMLVPKDVLSFRHGTQLDVVDSVVLAAFVKKIGAKLEKHRVPQTANRVFSYRYSPTPDGRLYGTETRWLQFWERSKTRAERPECTHVLVADIADFYNQIYHHAVENQLAAAGLKPAEQRVIKRFLSTYSETVSRGIPVGPHAVHLLAELALNPIDQELLAHGHDFCRYVDDFNIFCGSEEQAHGALYDLANSLDAQQRLILSRHKTTILSAADFVARAESMLIDRPINNEEAELLEIINDYVGDDPYAHIALSELSNEHLEALGAEALTRLLDIYLAAESTSFSRVGWFLRRLRQVGAPGAIDFLVENLERFAPVIGDVARYIMASAANYQGDPVQLGERIANQLDLPIVSKSPYLQTVLLDVLATVPGLNHAEAITARYDDAPQPVRREILRVAAANKLSGWLRGRKQEFRAMDPWSRPAYLTGLPALPGDEAEHWLRSIRSQLSPVERLVVRHAFRNRGMNVGETRIR